MVWHLFLLLYLAESIVLTGMIFISRYFEPVYRMSFPSGVSSNLKVVISWLAGPLTRLLTALKREPWQGQA
jgi:hypothetical protein